MEEESKGIDASSQEPAPATDSTNVPENLGEPKQPKHHTYTRKKLILLIVGVVIVVGGASAGATYYLTKPQSNSKNQEATDQTDQKPAINIEEKAVEVASAYTWLDTPKQLDTLPILAPQKTSEGSYAPVYEYFQLGSGADGSNVYLLAGEDMLGGRPYLVIVEKAGVYTIVKKNSNGYFYAAMEGEEEMYQGPELLPTIVIDSSNTIADMTVPTDVTFNGQKFKTTFIGTDVPYLEFMPTVPAPTEYSRYDEAGTNDQGRIYEVTSKDDPTYKVSRFVLRLKPALYAELRLEGELSREEVDPITWSDGSKNTENYATAARGCGIGTNVEIAKYGKDEFVQIGKTPQGQTIYGFKNSSNALLKKHYDEYIQDSGSVKEWVTAGDSYYSAEDFGKSLADYVAMRPLYVVEDALGRFLVFARSDLVLTGGCAKPVVYLYPTTPTIVDVEVGAQVTISDPQYEADGWQNVFAMPNGLLGYGGKQYDSLFWEGLGNGVYPEITNGTVVARDQVVSTMYDQLARQGLNSKESADFVEFWEAKIPSSPYVRLSWLNTTDLERLAPLYVSPLPDTRIRVFLDMEGLEQFVSIPSQQFYAPPRVGFTVVEWGGLATDGSVPILK